jgi:hypothetical protein
MPISSHSFYGTAIRDSLACWIEVKSAGHVQHPVFFRQELGENRELGLLGARRGRLETKARKMRTLLRATRQKPGNQTGWPQCGIGLWLWLDMGRMRSKPGWILASPAISA